MATGVAIVGILMLSPTENTAAESIRSSEAASSRRQDIASQCVADGGKPIEGVRLVYCLERWATHGKAVVMWERNWK